MKIVIGYPPLSSFKGIPFLAQNRQFQWSKNPWTAYPVILAQAATLLKAKKHKVIWLDGITRGLSQSSWLAKFKKASPDLLVLETKTPVVKKHWQLISLLKKSFPRLKIALVGDHVTALPEESFKNSPVDFVLTGGDYDFSLLALVGNLCQKTKLAPGTYWRAGKQIKNNGHFRLFQSLNKLPFIDRDLVPWSLYAYKNSNYGRTPGTYTMFGRDCWWGRCSFCSWTTLFPGKSFRSQSPQRALDEIGYLLDRWPIREIMDDSGTFPVGDWLREFCQGMIDRGYHKKIRIDCNMRFNSGLTQKDYRLMGRAGFRFILYGLESANQKTLDRLNKNLKVNQIRPVLKMAKSAGLWPHITVMVGYPWEGRWEVDKTLNLARELFKKGLVDTLQATVVIPYPGTPLFAECQKNNWLKTTDWNRYDMKEPIMTTSLGDQEIMALVRNLYRSCLTPQFIFRKTREVLGDWERFRYYSWLTVKFFGRLIDFSSPRHEK